MIDVQKNIFLKDSLELSEIFSKSFYMRNFFFEVSEMFKTVF